MTDAEKREAAHQFINRWMGRGNEDEDGRSYWLEFLSNVMGMENPTERVNFEKKVIVNGNTKRIDVYIPETHVIIEQKSLGKSLDQKIHNSGDVDLTPYEQAKRYNDNLPYDEKARWIITCNFSDIWIYDMNARVPEPVKIALVELQSKYLLLDFLVKQDVKKLSHEMEVSIKAGDIVGLIYDAFLKQYKIPDGNEKQESAEQKEKREHKLKGYWQRLAKIYAPLMESDKKFYNAICGYIRDYLKSDMNVLELACGTGQLSFPLSDCTNSWTATDFSENMIKQAKRRGTTEKLSFCVADATALSYENENFDCVVISNALHIMPEPEKAMQEIRRVLKKDGILYAPTFLWAEKKSSGLRKRLMSITGFKAYKEWNKENFCEFITDYGFTVVKVNLVDGGLAPVGVLIAKKTNY